MVVLILYYVKLMKKDLKNKNDINEFFTYFFLKLYKKIFIIYTI